MKSLWKLIGFVKPLSLQMATAVVCGVLGHLCAIAIPVVSVLAALCAVGGLDYPLPLLFAILACASILRGVFAYIEQQRNHYIAFTVLAIIRDKVCGALRKLAPAKLEGKKRGELISLITSDIELLEVFFAHTISPTLIAAFIALLVAAIQFQFSPLLALVSLAAHALIGFVLPVLRAGNKGEVHAQYRAENAALSGYYLDSLRGIDEIIQLQNGAQRVAHIQERTQTLDALQKQKARLEGDNSALAEGCVLFCGAAMLVLASVLCQNAAQAILATVLMLSSFGPFLSLSKLTVGLGGTIASAGRVLALLQEEPEVEDVETGATPPFDGVAVKGLDFSYGEEQILQNVTLAIENHKITGVLGKSGSGKSTLVKLMMRFWNSKGISIGGEALENINTKHLRAMESYMTQDSDIFAQSIMENIRVGCLGATDEQVIEAAKKASLHGFVMSLKDGYHTQVGELGDTLSGGEKQRIGLARAFLHDGDLLVLDEPTSNLDSLNESIILRSIQQHNKATILISHRASTLGICEERFTMQEGRCVQIVSET